MIRSSGDKVDSSHMILEHRQEQDMIPLGQAMDHQISGEDPGSQVAAAEEGEDLEAIRSEGLGAAISFRGCETQEMRHD